MTTDQLGLIILCVTIGGCMAVLAYVVTDAVLREADRRRDTPKWRELKKR